MKKQKSYAAIGLTSVGIFFLSAGLGMFFMPEMIAIVIAVVVTPTITGAIFGEKNLLTARQRVEKFNESQKDSLFRFRLERDTYSTRQSVEQILSKVWG